MSVSDITLIQQATYSLLENGAADATGTSLITTMFSLQQIINALDQSQERFVRDTGMIVVNQQIAAAPGVNRYDIPNNNCVMVRRVSYQVPQTTGTPNRTIALTRADTWEQDHGIQNWDTSPNTPISWWETTLESLRLGVAPAPIASGFFNLLYVYLAATLNGSGINLSIPDDWSPYVLWCALGVLLDTDGQSYDPVRAGYCFRRYDEGVELARMVLRGF